MKGDCNKSLKLLFRRGIEDLHDDEFEGSKEEDSIFREVFFGQENDKTSKKCLVTGAINFENEYKKPKDGSFGCNSDNSVMTTQTDSENVKESDELTLSARNDPDVEVKRRKVVPEQQFDNNPYLEKVPLKETDSCLFQPTTVVTCRLVESSAHGFKSSCYLLKGTIAELTASKSRLSTSDTNDQKTADVSAAIASPVSQESHVSKLVVIRPEPIQTSKRKWKDSSFVEVDENELLTPPEESKTDPKTLLRFHIHRLFKEAKWAIVRRNRTKHCKGHGEFVYKAPSGRPIREFHRAWSICGQKLVEDASYVVGDSNGIQWTSLTEFQSDFNDTLIEIEEQLRNLEPKTALAHWWYLLDPFAKVVLIDKSLRLFKEGKPVNTTRTVVNGFYLSDDTVLPPNNQDDVMETNERNEHKKSKKLSEMKLTDCYGMQETSEISGQLKSNMSESYESCIKSSFCSSDNQLEKKQPAFKKSIHKHGKEKKEKKGNYQLNDDDLLLSALLKNRSSKKLSASKKKSRVPKAPRRLNKGSKGRCRLRPRSLTKGGQQQVEGRWSGIGFRTVLSWLIDFRVINVNEVIQYRNPRDDLVTKDGLVTRDGILCRCCEKILSVSEFKVHAGFTLKGPCLNLFMESGKPFTLCQLEAWSAEYKIRRGATRTIEVEDIDENDDSCGLCGDGGELVCCDNCPSTFHLKCLCVEELPEGNWYCSKCSCWICGNLVNDTQASSSSTLKCVQCEHKYHEECVREKGTERELVSSATWFCGESCEEIHSGLNSRIGIMNPVSDGFTWTLLKCIHGDLKVHSGQRLVALKAECNMKLAVALTIMEECFLPMVDPRTGIDMIPHVVYNWGSEFARLDYEGFYTMILEKDDVILCVASVRIHGAHVAEMPLIATCNRYRRQGMCRRLMNSIEELLKSLKVEKLVVSAIPSLVDTWTQGFGFAPLEADEKKTLTKTNLMVFPGTVWLKKPMYQGATQDTTTEAVVLHEDGAQDAKLSLEEPEEGSKGEGGSVDTGFEVNPVITSNFE